MATKFAKIPKTAWFPWHFDILILQVAPDDPELQGNNANWDDNTNTIRIDKTLTIAEKRWCLLHEMEHAFNDWKLWVGQRARLRTPQEPTDEETDNIDGGVGSCGVTSCGADLVGADVLDS